MTKERYLLIMKYVIMALRHATSLVECVTIACNLGYNFNVKKSEVYELFNTSPADYFNTTCKVFGFYYDGEKREE